MDNNVRVLRYDWRTGLPTFGSAGAFLARQYDHLSDMVVLTHAPVLENYYLIVTMKETEGGEVKTLKPIQLSGSFWLIPNVYTQLAQDISFQFCCKTENGDFEAHSAEIIGRILPSKAHNGEALDVNPSVMFDPYKKWVEEIAMAAGAIVIDSELSSTSTNPVQNKVIKAAVDGITEDINIVNGRLREQGVTVSAIEGKVPVIDAVAENYREVKPDNWHNIDADTVGILKADGTVVESETRFYTDYISVVPGDIVRTYASTTQNRVYFKNITFYNAEKVVMPTAGSDTTGSYDITVPESAAFIRLTFGTDYQNKIIITINLIPTDWSIQYFEPYSVLVSDMVTEESQIAINNAKNLKNGTVKGTNLVTSDNTYVGICYWSSNRMVIDETKTTYRYVVIPLKKNTRYTLNAYCRYYIFTDDNNNRISSGEKSVGGLFFDSGEATRLYYTLPKSNYDIGFIVSEGCSGTLANVVKPTFLGELNQLMFDSWFAVALPPTTIRFTVGIAEKLYYYNMLSLAKNMIALTLGIGNDKDEEGVIITPAAQVINANTYGYIVYDDNLAVVANAPRGGRNRLTIVADNVQDCSALIIGDSIIARDNGYIGQTMIDAFTQRGKTLTLLGTRGTGDSKHEGRSGWSTTDYFTAQKGDVTNPFYNPTTETFDFTYYMQNQGYTNVDFVFLHLGGNDLFNVTLSETRESIRQTENNLCTIIESILAWNPDQKIVLQLCPTTSAKWGPMSAVGANPVFIRAKFVSFNADMLYVATKYLDNVHVSNDYLIIDPNNDLADHIHPTQTGLAKIGMELVSQINVWQSGN